MLSTINKYVIGPLLFMIHSTIYIRGTGHFAVFCYCVFKCVYSRMVCCWEKLCFVIGSH